MAFSNIVIHYRTLQAFVVRPFGVKNGVDFERVDRELISPALDRLQMTGRTTQEIARAGNIRADMFHLLLTADIVIADISIHNANVFYELGVRHALRDRRTFLLRAAIDEVAFDLTTDRYLLYDPANPAACLDLLVTALAETRRSGEVDSPVYSMLPGLPKPDASAFVIVPQSFQREVTHARLNGEKGDLRFLASELTGLPWRREGLRLVGEAQFQVGDLRYAAQTWEAVRAELPDDVTANLRLGTIYQKLNDLARSDEAFQRVIALEVARSQFEVFKSLGVLPKTVSALESLFAAGAEPPQPDVRPKALLFTGHRIDDPGRPSPRFPASREPVARQAILETVERELPCDGRPVIAIAGGASGGDLIFQEICEQLAIERRLYLIIPRDDYAVASVAPAGPDWVERFNHQLATAPCHRIYQEGKDLPDWLADKPNYGVWQRSNIWMLHNALSIGDTDTTLIALWDGEGGDGPGGAGHMVQSVREHGARAIVVDSKQLFGL